MTLPLLIGAQLPSLSSSELWKIRTAIQKAGGLVESLCVNYQIRQPQSSVPQKPKACVDCCYYYEKCHGNAQLICGLHPYGSSDDLFQDWEAPNDVQGDSRVG